MNQGNLPIDITTRDIDILRGFYESRLMTLAHVAAIYFGNRREAAKKRVQKLKRARLLAERPRKNYQRSILHLTGRGFSLLHTRGELRRYPSATLKQFLRRVAVSAQTVEHELEVMDCRAALHNTLAGHPTLRLDTMTTWPRLHAFTLRRDGRSTKVRPDAFCRIIDEQHRAQAFYLELDRSTETTSRALDRARDYVAHYRTGGFAIAQGARAGDARRHPFRVLWVCRSEQRITSLSGVFRDGDLPSLGMMWFTTLHEFCQDALGPSWTTPSRQVGDPAQRPLIERNATSMAA